MLTDIDEVAQGPTQVGPCSHLFGATAPNPIEGTAYEDQGFSGVGPAGSVTIFNNQVWPRGAPHAAGRARAERVRAALGQQHALLVVLPAVLPAVDAGCQPWGGFETEIDPQN